MRRGLGWIGGLLLAMVVAGFPVGAEGHQRSTSFSYWTEEGDAVSVRLVFPWVEAAVAWEELREAVPERALEDPALRALLRERFAERVRVGGTDGDCSPFAWQEPVLRDGALVFAGAGRCPGGARSLFFTLSFDEAPSHVHLVRFEREGERLAGIVTADAREWIVAPSDRSAASPSFLALGFEHILAGPDHLVFLLALMLLSTSFAALALLITGFTLSHSLSLALAVTGRAAPDIATIEALIGFTVAFAALEVLLTHAGDGNDAARLRRQTARGAAVLCAALPILSLAGVLQLTPVLAGGVMLFSICYLLLDLRSERARWLVVFLFGFLHGFGFAGPLLEMRLDAADTARALLGFNVGVEAGQLAFLAVAWPVVRRLGQSLRRPAVAAALAAVILAAGVHWFLSRAL